MADTEGLEIDMKGDRFGIPLLHYAAKNSYRENPVLEKLQEYTEKNVDMAVMLACQEELQLLANIARCMGVKKALDIGVYTGSSALAIAQVLPDDGKVIGCELTEEFSDVAKPFWKEAGVEHKIDVRIGPAKDTLEALVAAGEEGAYDFAFIDADKPNYIHYYELCMKLVRPGGLIAVDNTFWDGKVIDESNEESWTKAIRAINEVIRKDPRVSPNQLFIGDGTTLVFKL